MKQLIRCAVLIFLLLPLNPVRAQILNAGFESWTSGSPDSWFTNNAPTLYTTVTQSTDAHSGSLALKGSTVSYLSTVLPPIVAAGSSEQGFSITTRNSSITGYYKFTPAGGDSLYITVVMYKGGTGIGAGFIAIGGTVSSYTQFTVPIAYATGDTPDKVTILFNLKPGSSAYHVGTSFLIDDITLGAVTDVSANQSPVPTVFNLSQNFPDPFNPSTQIDFSLPQQSNVQLKVYTTLGQLVTTLVNGNLSAGSHSATFNAQNLASGLYIYRLTAGNFTSEKKMLLLK
ncbi:MAG: T9SS type A sorting domain-containing protein [Bacteroidota bacterium]